MAELSFKVCRVCLATETNSLLSSLFHGTGEKAEMLLVLTGIDVANHQNVKDYQALICSECSEDLDRAFAMRQRASYANGNHFTPATEAAVSRQASVKRESMRLNARKESESTIISDNTAMDKVFEAYKKKACAICKKVMLRSSLRRHIREIHEAKITKHFGDKERFYHQLGLQPSPENTTLSVQSPTTSDSSIGAGNQKKFECSICQQMLSTKKRLEDHIDNIHMEKRRFFCDLCNLSYWNRNSLKRHMTTHLQGAENDALKVKRNATKTKVSKMLLYQCWIQKCQQTFKNPKELSQHYSNHYDKSGGTFACDCSATFKKMAYLRRHIQRVHQKKSKMPSG